MDRQVSPVIEKRDLVIERVFDAPRELVWQAWTEPEHFKQWWGPKDFTTPHCTIDLRVGGKNHICMRSPEGHNIWCLGVYVEIAPPERLVCKVYFSDEHGNVVSPTMYDCGEDWPEEVVATVVLEEVDGKTKMTMTQADIPMIALREGATQGWSESFDKLAALIEQH
jgi:uncharacterized protein YndB with AHSA1/START domain